MAAARIVLLAPLSGVTIMVTGGLVWSRRAILGTGSAVMECIDDSPCLLVVNALPSDTTLSWPPSRRHVSSPSVSWVAAENAESGHSPLIGVHWAGGGGGRTAEGCTGLPGTAGGGGSGARCVMKSLNDSLNVGRGVVSCWYKMGLG